MPEKNAEAKTQKKIPTMWSSAFTAPPRRQGLQAAGRHALTVRARLPPVVPALRAERHRSAVCACAEPSRGTPVRAPTAPPATNVRHGTSPSPRCGPRRPPQD